MVQVSKGTEKGQEWLQRRSSVGRDPSLGRMELFPYDLNTKRVFCYRPEQNKSERKKQGGVLDT